MTVLPQFTVAKVHLFLRRNTGVEAWKENFERSPEVRGGYLGGRYIC